MNIAPPTIGDIEEAASRLAGLAVRTPLLECPAADAACGGKVLIKAEMLQRTGSFKFRGAYNCISHLTSDQRKNGVVAFSSGNHAQGVAAVANMFGIPATIVMPTDAPSMKIDATRGYGAKVVLYDRFTESREDIAGTLVEKQGLTLIPPFDHPLIIAGQGTVGLEIAEDMAARGEMPDQILVPCGGGGLISGIATAVTSKFSDSAIHAVEPKGFDDTARSLVSGSRESVDRDARSICDALLVPTPGELTFPINQRLLAGGVSVSDDQVRHAMAFSFRHMKLVAEPGGAVALAAALAGAIDCANKTTIVVMSGGNVDPEMFAEIISRLPSAND
ncbi:MAG: threonine dehydratase [Alphaproteobacteria bacterium]|jgi:threonine dehydratase